MTPTPIPPRERTPHRRAIVNAHPRPAHPLVRLALWTRQLQPRPRMTRRCTTHPYGSGEWWWRVACGGFSRRGSVWASGWPLARIHILR